MFLTSSVSFQRGKLWLSAAGGSTTVVLRLWFRTCSRLIVFVVFSVYHDERILMHRYYKASDKIRSRDLGLVSSMGLQITMEASTLVVYSRCRSAHVFGVPSSLRSPPSIPDACRWRRWQARQVLSRILVTGQFVVNLGPWRRSWSQKLQTLLGGVRLGSGWIVPGCTRWPSRSCDVSALVFEDQGCCRDCGAHFHKSTVVFHTVTHSCCSCLEILQSQ